MLQALVAEIGPWSWWILGLVLLGAEILIPGIFLIWIGLAAIVVGAISFILWDSAIWGWQVQLLVFAALSLISALIGRRIMAGRDDDTDISSWPGDQSGHPECSSSGRRGYGFSP